MCRYALLLVVGLVSLFVASCGAAQIRSGDLQVVTSGNSFRCVSDVVGVFAEGTVTGGGPGRGAGAGAAGGAGAGGGRAGGGGGGMRWQVDRATNTLTATVRSGLKYTFALGEGGSSITLSGEGGRVGVTLNVLRWGSSPLPCRLEPGTQANVIHAQLGISSYPGFASLYDPISDSALTSTRSAGPGVLWEARVSRDFMRVSRGLKWFRYIDKSYFKTPPSGWCSWYYYYRGLTESEAIKNLDWMADNLEPFGAEYFQIDDIWQARGDEDARYWRDWSGVNQPNFPQGMKWLADQVHARGMKPGIWLACFGNSNSELVKSNPKLWLVNEKGEYVDAGWVGRYLCDPSSPEGQKYMTDLFTKLARDWGYDYFKIDGQPPTVQMLSRNQKSLKNPALAGDEAYRAGLNAIRKAIGPERFLLGCWGTPTEGIGIMNGSRTGGDVAANWQGFRPAIDCTMRWYFTHNVAWYADPDTLLVRPPLTLDQARCWASLYGLTGQLLMASDKMYELPQDRVEVLKRVFPAADITPMCLYPQPGRARLFHLAARIPGEGMVRDVVGLFNWEERANPVELKFADINPDWAGASVALYDFWNKRYLGRFTDQVTFSQRPTSCEVLSACRVRQRPELISTSRHITQGGLDLAQADFEPQVPAWSGVSRCVAGDPYTLSFLLDVQQNVYTITRANTSGPAATIQVDGAVGHVTFTPQESGEVVWRVEFAQTERVARPRLGAVRNLQVTADHWTRMTVSWDAVPDAVGYQVVQDGKALGLYLGTSMTVTDLKPASEHSFAVQAVGPRGGLGPMSPAVAARTLETPKRPEKPQVYITELTPKSSRIGWGTLHFDRSVEGNPLRIGDETFSHGIGTHAVSEIVYDIRDRGFKQFVALVGVDKEISAPEGTVAFQVVVDGKRKFDSGVIGAKDSAMGVAVDVAGARELRLIVTDGGDNINYDHADWADAGFLK
jgi:hypothetical protein